jgi:hypothetical protein
MATTVMFSKCKSQDGKMVFFGEFFGQVLEWFRHPGHFQPPWTNSFGAMEVHSEFGIVEGNGGWMGGKKTEKELCGTDFALLCRNFRGFWK